MDFPLIDSNIYLFVGLKVS